MSVKKFKLGELFHIEREGENGKMQWAGFILWPPGKIIIQKGFFAKFQTWLGNFPQHWILTSRFPEKLLLLNIALHCIQKW